MTYKVHVLLRVHARSPAPHPDRRPQTEQTVAVLTNNEKGTNLDEPAIQEVRLTLRLILRTRLTH